MMHRLLTKHVKMFKFSVGANGKTLEVNGVTAYPASPFRWPKSLRAPQLPAGADAKKIKGCMRNVLTISEYSWAFHAEGISDEGGEVIFGTFHPASLENEPIHVPSVSVKMIRDVEGGLTIASVTQEDADKALPSIPFIGEHGESGECHGPMIFCKLQDMMKNSFKGLKSAVKGCGKKAKNAHGKIESHPFLKDGDHSKSSDDDTVIAPPPQHGFARVAHILAHVSKMVLLPMLIGVLAGFLVYAVGMAVGLFIAFVWIAIRKWRAGGRGTYVHLSEDDEALSEGAVEEEVDVKDMLKSEYISEKEQQEPLPVYQETDDKEVAPQ